MVGAGRRVANNRRDEEKSTEAVQVDRRNQRSRVVGRWFSAWEEVYCRRGASHFPIGGSQSGLSQSVSQPASRAQVVSLVADLPSMEIQLPRREHYASQLSAITWHQSPRATPFRPSFVMTFDCAPPTDIRLNKQY